MGAFVPTTAPGALVSTARVARICTRRVARESLTSRTSRTRMSTSGPEAPADFKAPEPRRAYVRPDALGRILSGSVGAAFRGGAGAVVEGYRFKVENGKLVEYSSTLPETRPKQPLVLYEFEACPYCRKVREALNALDLDVLVKPCPKDGKIFRPYVKETFGKAQFPYLEDPNTGFGGYESDDIIRYLYKTYGPPDANPPSSFGGFGNLTASLASAATYGRGMKRESATVPSPKPLEVWGYEPSPFSKIVRERLCELELPYILHTVPRGSPTRKQLAELTGRFQAPYLVDPNTGVSMFESADICDYLTATYGPSAPGALEDTSAAAAAAAAPVAKDLNPKAPVDDKLEEYCKDSPEADECRTYDN